MSDALDHALSLHRSGDLTTAERLYREISEASPDYGPAQGYLGVLLVMAGRPNEAVKTLENARRFSPGSAAICSNLGVAYRQAGDLDRARISFEEATCLDSDFADAHCNLADALNRTGDHGGAISSARAALALSPDMAEAHNNLGEAFLALEDATAAETAFRKAVDLAPGNAGFMANLGISELMRNNEADAKAAFARALDIDPMNRLVLAYASLPGTDRAEKAFPFDPEEHAVVFDLPPGQGYASQPEFAAALETTLSQEFGLQHEPAGKATKAGSQTGGLYGSGHPATVSLEHMIADTLKTYVSVMQARKEHPYFDRSPTSHTLSLWGTLLDPDGRQSPHIHPAGWVSGVYYPSVPDTIDEDDPACRGWIEFGPPAFKLPQNATIPRRRICPKPGRMILFPSFAFHSTIPVEQAAGRVSFAFDVYPVF